jgi:aminopeptidase-like protein
LKLYLLAIEKLEQDRTFRSKMPYGEPMLGKRGLYPSVGGSIKQAAADASTRHGERRYEVQDERILYGNELDAIRWLMFYGDGQTPLLDVAEKTGLPLRQLAEVAEKLVGQDLLEEM